MSDKTHRPHPQKQEENSTLHLLISSLWGVLAFVLSAGIFLLLSSAICLRLPDPNKMLLPFALVSLFVPALLCGIISVRKCGGKAIPVGLLSGFWLMLLTFLAAWVLPSQQEGMSFGLSFALRLLLPFFTVLGSLIGINLRRSKRRRR